MKLRLLMLFSLQFGQECFASGLWLSQGEWLSVLSLPVVVVLVTAISAFALRNIAGVLLSLLLSLAVYGLGVTLMISAKESKPPLDVGLLTGMGWVLLLFAPLFVALFVVKGLAARLEREKLEKSYHL